MENVTDVATNITDTTIRNMQENTVIRNITIRNMQEADLEQVARIERDTFSEPWSREGFRTSLVSSDTLYLVAVCGDQIAGYCGLLRSFEEADITNVAVDEKYRKKGIARRMLTSLMEEGKTQGILRYTLEVRKSNEAALHLYETLGFENVGIRKGFYAKPLEDAVIMWTR